MESEGRLFFKQWPLAPNSRESLITCANVSRQVTFFSKMAFGECQRVWRVRSKQVGKCRRVWRVQANQVGKCRRVWQVLAKPLDECWHNKDRLFYAQITYFIFIKWSSLHSLNLPNSPNLPNLPNSRKTCFWRDWRVWLGKCWRVRANQVGKCRQILRVQPLFKKGHFGEYSNWPKMANFWRVLEFDKFAVEWPLLTFFTQITHEWGVFFQIYTHVCWNIFWNKIFCCIMYNNGILVFHDLTWYSSVKFNFQILKFKFQVPF